tara:strand:- start:295 stop:489 length:195 start_codon:yes stop_codon:yes gene_type:complete
MTVPELIDKLEEIKGSLDTGKSQPRLLNDVALKAVQVSINELISDLEFEGILDNEGYRQSGRLY